MSSLNYQHLSTKSLMFLRLTGMKVEEFQTMCAGVKPSWQEKIESQKKCQGRCSLLHYFET